MAALFSTQEIAGAAHFKVEGGEPETRSEV